MLHAHCTVVVVSGAMTARAEVFVVHPGSTIAASRMSIDGATTFIADEPEPRADVVRLQLQMLASVELEHDRGCPFPNPQL